VTVSPPAPTTPSTTRRVELRPRYEGANVGTWIGFKHVNYLIEDAVLAWFREGGFSATDLYHENALCLDVVGIDTRIVHALRVDDLVLADVRQVGGDGPELTLKVTLRVEDGGPRMVASTVAVALRLDARDEAVKPAPAELTGHVVERLGRPGDASPIELGGADPVAALTARYAVDGVHNGIVWGSVIPYYHCHFTERLQMSGYLRLMEEAKHRFVAERGVSIKTLLDESGWIPAVPHSRLTLLDEAYMEEQLFTVFTVDRVFKRLTYTSRLDTYVLRDGVLLPTATGEITHGYAALQGRSEWGLVSFDDRLLAALTGSATTP
jgi:acyl-CoA thioesterase FadM